MSYWLKQCTFREHVLLIVLTLLVMLKFNLWLFA